MLAWFGWNRFTAATEVAPLPLTIPLGHDYNIRTSAAVVAHHTLYAYLEEPARHLVYLLRCDGGGGKVDPERSIDLNVDEARGDDAAFAVHRLVCEELVRIGGFPEAGLWVDDATVCGGIGAGGASERTNKH